MSSALDVVIKLTADGVSGVQSAFGSVARAMNGLTDDIEAAHNQTARLQRALEQARSGGASVEEIARHTQNLEDHLNSAQGQAAQLQGRLMGMRNAGAGMVAAGGAGILLGNALAEAGNDVEESENLVKESFGSSLAEAQKWSNGLQETLGLNAMEVRKNAATFNVMFESMKIGSDESMKMSKGLTQLAYDMSSFYNLDPSEAFEKLRGGITGEAEGLKALGILVNEETVKQYAYANGIAKAGEQLTEQQKVQARYAAILDQTKKAQGDLNRTMDSGANVARRMENAAKIAQHQIGKGAAEAKKNVDNLSGWILSVANASPERK